MPLQLQPSMDLEQLIVDHMIFQEACLIERGNISLGMKYHLIIVFFTVTLNIFAYQMIQSYFDQIFNLILNSIALKVVTIEGKSDHITDLQTCLGQ